MPPSTHDNQSPWENIRQASPCKEAWENMSGDECVRMCGACSQYVYNLNVNPDLAEHLIIKTEGRLPIALYRRSDGTILTSDCPLNQIKKKEPETTFFGTLYGPAWRSFARTVKGQFLEARDAGEIDRVVFHHKEQMVTLCIFTALSNKTVMYTHISTNRKFIFNVHRTTPLSTIGIIFGMQDVHINDPSFDDAFIIQGNDIPLLQAFLSDTEMRHIFLSLRRPGQTIPGRSQDKLITAFPAVELRMDTNSINGNPLPAGTNELRLVVYDEVVTDEGSLIQMFQLFTKAISQIQNIGLATPPTGG